MKKQIAFILFTLFYLLLSGCKMADSDTLVPSEIWASFELFYDEEENRTYATAVFHEINEDGSYVWLTPPSTVSFEGDTLTWRQEWATYYVEYPGWVQSGEFAFTDNQGGTRRFFATMEKIDFPSTFGPIRKHQSYELIWEGLPVQVQEEVHALVFNTVTNQVPNIHDSGVCPRDLFPSLTFRPAEILLPIRLGPRV